MNFLPLVLGLYLALSFPLDQELKSKLSGDGHNFETICKVTKAGDTYIYMYSIKNNDKTTIRVKWDVLSRAMYFGSRDIQMLIEVEPGENVNFVLEHPDPPIEIYGIVQGFPLTKREDLVKMAQDANFPKIKVKIPKGVIFRSVIGNSSGALPKSYLKLHH